MHRYASGYASEQIEKEDPGLYNEISMYFYTFDLLSKLINNLLPNLLILVYNISLIYLLMYMQKVIKLLKDLIFNNKQVFPFFLFKKNKKKYFFIAFMKSMRIIHLNFGKFLKCAGG